MVSRLLSNLLLGSSHFSGVTLVLPVVLALEVYL